MKGLSPLERAVLDAIALQVPEVANALAAQQTRVISRENTGAGFYTTIDASRGIRIEGVTSPVGDVGTTVAGLANGMGFLLWLRDGRISGLEGYSYEESTSGLDFESVSFGTVCPRS